jgi:2-polyprenyl-3-methyl-5-hydroxy-6-metoxy-1,4-benzoquinol methylase
MSSESRTGTPCPVCGGAAWESEFSGIRDWEFGTPGRFQYVRCHGCRLVRLDPFPDLEMLKAAYPDDYVAFSAEKGRGFIYTLMNRVRQARARARLRKLVPEGAKVLDVGCGSGDLLVRLRDMGAREVRGLDFSPTATAICREKDLDVETGTFPDYPETSGDFDAIFMINYIEHVQDPLVELKKAAMLLRPGGILIGELPNFDSLDRVLFRQYWGGNHCPRHTYQFGPTILTSILRTAGFETIDTRQDINPGHLALSIQNWLQRKRDLANNTALSFGRSKYLALLILALIPIGVLQALCGASGNMTFTARAIDHHDDA